MDTEDVRPPSAVMEAIVAEEPVMVALFRAVADEFVYAYVNRAYQAMKPRTELIGRSMGEIWPETADSVVPMFRGIYESGEPLTVADAEFTLERESGVSELRRFSFDIRPLVVDGERFLLEVADDVTGLVHEREDASETATRLEELLDRMTDAVVGFDPQWRFIFANRPAEQVLSKAAGVLLGKVIWDEFPGLESLRGKLEQASADQQPVSFREYYGPLGAWLDVRAYPSESGLTVFFANANEAVRAEEERRQTLRALEEKDRAIRQAYTDVISAATGGRLVILGKDELDSSMLGDGEPTYEITEPAELSEARARVGEVVSEQLGEETDGMLVAVSEGLTNMLKHADGGTYRICLTPQRVRVVLVDHGHGIDFRSLPKATLLPGFSTAQSLGMGFTLMMELCDQLLLSTDEDGTVLVLEKELAGGSPYRLHA